MELDGNSGIYKITNTNNGKCYIGSSQNIEKRFRGHRYMLTCNSHHSRYFQNAWNKYGDERFMFEILEVVDDRAKLFEREQHYLDQFSREDKLYNTYKVAGSSAGYKHTKEALKKISRAFKGKPKTEKHRLKLGHPGSKHFKARPIKGVEIEGSKVLKYSYVREAEKDGFHQAAISRVCTGQQKSHKGYTWEYLG
jgi:group I intron endonuclease